MSQNINRYRPWLLKNARFEKNPQPPFIMKLRPCFFYRFSQSPGPRLKKSAIDEAFSNHKIETFSQNAIWARFRSVLFLRRGEGWPHAKHRLNLLINTGMGFFAKIAFRAEFWKKKCWVRHAILLITGEIRFFCKWKTPPWNWGKSSFSPRRQHLDWQQRLQCVLL